MAEPKANKRPNAAFLRKYGYTIKRSSSNPNVGVVYDRNGNKVKPSEYRRNVENWNRSQQAVRQENQRRSTQKEPYQAQSDTFRGRYQRGRNLTKKEVKRLQSQTENVMSGAVIAPSHIIGAVGRKIADPSRDLSELYWTGYDDQGVNAGYVTDEFARNHPEWATVANLAGDVALGAALGRFSGGEPGTRSSIDTYDYAGPRLQIGAGEQPAGYLGTRNLPAVRTGSEMVPVDAPLALEGRKLPALYPGTDVGPAWTPRPAQQQLSFSPNMTVRGTSEVGFPRQTRAAAARGPVDLDYRGTIYEQTPGSPVEFTPRFPWWAWPDYYEGNGNPDAVYNIPEITVTGTPPQSPVPTPNGGGKGRRSRKTNTRNRPSASQEQRIPNNLGPAVADAILQENRIPDYSPAAIEAAHGNKWNAVKDMHGNTIIQGSNMVGNEYDAYKYAHPEAVATMAPTQYAYAVNPGYSINPYQNADGTSLDMQRAIDEFDPRNYGFGGVFYI